MGTVNFLLEIQEYQQDHHKIKDCLLELLK